MGGAVGRKVSLGHIHLSLLSGSLAIDEVSIGDDPAFGAEPFISAKAVSVGVEMMPLIEGGEIIERLGDRILGRVVLEDIVDPYTGEVLCPSNSEITEEHVKIIDNAGIDRVKIRSVLACETRRGICSLCYGRDLARGGRSPRGSVARAGDGETRVGGTSSGHAR